MFGLLCIEMFGLLFAIGGIAMINNYIEIADYLHTILGNMGVMTKAEGTYNLLDGMRVLGQIAKEVQWLQSYVYSIGYVVVIVGGIILIAGLYGMIRITINNKYARNN